MAAGQGGYWAAPPSIRVSPPKDAAPTQRALLRLARDVPRVLERRVDLDVEPLRRLGVEVGVGEEAASMDAVNGAEVVDLVDVAGHADRTDDLAGRIADELAATFHEQGTVGK